MLYFCRRDRSLTCLFFWEISHIPISTTLSPSPLERGDPATAGWSEVFSTNFYLYFRKLVLYIYIAGIVVFGVLLTNMGSKNILRHESPVPTPVGTPPLEGGFWFGVLWYGRKRKHIPSPSANGSACRERAGLPVYNR